MILRQWELLKRLPTRGSGASARELTSALNQLGFEVSKRQVERDLQDLSTVFPLHCNDNGVPFGWRWADNCALDLPGLTLADAVSLRMVEDILQPLLPPAIHAAMAPRFREAERKLASLGAAHVGATWTDKVRSVSPGLEFKPPQVDPDVLGTVQEALLVNEQLDVRYRSGEKSGTVMLRLHPLALVSRHPNLYLVATAFDYDDVRRYALHRFEHAARTGQVCKRPPDFTLDDYLKTGGLQFGNGQMLKLAACVSVELASLLAETPLADDQQLVPEAEGFLLTATIPDSWALRWWLLGEGANIEVRQPTTLRQEIADRLASALQLYAAP
jgi:predicted DNA-binding transcriptional regulator YafY